MRSTRVHRHIRAPRATVYRLLLDPAAVAAWKAPDGMTAHVHTFQAHEGGAVLPLKAISPRLTTGSACATQND